MSKELISNMVSRFLGWKLPKDFEPDAGISFKREANPLSPEHLRFNHEPIGTNLFHAGQAEAMLLHVAAPLLDRITELETQLLDAKQALQQITADMVTVEMRYAFRDIDVDSTFDDLDKCIVAAINTFNGEKK